MSSISFYNKYLTKKTCIEKKYVDSHAARGAIIMWKRERAGGCYSKEGVGTPFHPLSPRINHRDRLRQAEQRAKDPFGDSFLLSPGNGAFLLEPLFASADPQDFFSLSLPPPSIASTVLKRASLLLLTTREGGK